MSLVITGFLVLVLFVVPASAADLSVRDFGATGDGKTDDTRAIQTAINAAEAGATIYFPPGIYLVSNFKVQKRKNLTFTGPAEIKRKIGGSPRIATFSEVSNMTITELRFDANNVHEAGDYGGIAFYNAKHILIQNTTFRDSNPGPPPQKDRYAYVFGGGQEHSENIKILNNTFVNLNLEVDFSRHVEVVGNTFLHSAGTSVGSFSLKRCGDTPTIAVENILVTHNVAIDPKNYAFAALLDPPNSPNCIFRNIQFLNNTAIMTTSQKAAFYIGTSNYSVPANHSVFDNIKVNSNTIWYSSGEVDDSDKIIKPRRGIFVNNSSNIGVTMKNISIENNSITYATPGGVMGIDTQLLTTSTIARNTVRGVRNGIAIIAPQSVSIVHNTVEATNWGYHLRDSRGDNIMRDNVILNQNNENGYMIRKLDNSDIVEK